MERRPTLEADRLILRPFTLADAPDVQRLAGDKAIAATTLNIPHPYEDGVAENWIESHQEKFEKGQLVNFAITLRANGPSIGSQPINMASTCRSATLPADRGARVDAALQMAAWTLLSSVQTAQTTTYSTIEMHGMG